MGSLLVLIMQVFWERECGDMNILLILGRLCLEKSAGSFELEVCMGGGMYTGWVEVQLPSGEQK